jgi:SAM-dependent methyltransferase
MRLVCPACRGFREGVFSSTELDADFACPRCDTHWPALAVGHVRVPVLWGDPELGHRTAHATRDLLANLQDIDGWLAGTNDLQRTELATALATYAPAHWGPYAVPALPVTDLAWVREWAPASADLPEGPVLVLGCGPGGELPYLDLPDRELVALDANLALVGYAAALAAGKAVRLPWRRLPSRIESRPLDLPPHVRHVLARTRLVCGDALDPPFAPESFAAVVALNLLDSVQDPALLLGQCEALLAPGGVLLLASPYHWQDAVTPPQHQLDRVLPADVPQQQAMEQLVAGPGGLLPEMRLERSADGIVWEVAVHARFSARYLLHVMRLRKSAATI